MEVLNDETQVTVYIHHNQQRYRLTQKVLKGLQDYTCASLTVKGQNEIFVRSKRDSETGRSGVSDLVLYRRSAEMIGHWANKRVHPVLNRRETTKSVVLESFWCK